MAEIEYKTILTVDTSASTTSVADLSDKIGTLRTALRSGTVAMEDQNAVVEKLAQLQGQLKDAMNGTTEAGVEAARNIDIESASYNDLVHTLAELTKAWRATTDAQERANLGERLNEVNQKLKDLDATKGTYVRNVGNYASVWDKWGGSINGALEGLGRIGPVVGQVTAATKGLGVALKGLSANPIGAIIMAVGQLASLVPRIVEYSQAHSEAAKVVEKHKEAVEQLKWSLTESEKEMKYATDLLRAAGKSEDEIYNTTIDYLTKMSSEALRKETEMRDALALMSKSHREKERENYEKVVAERKRIDELLRDEVKKRNIREVAEYTKSENDKKKAAEEAAKAAADARKKAAEDTAKMIADIDADIERQEQASLNNTLASIEAETAARQKEEERRAAIADRYRQQNQDAQLTAVEHDMDAAIFANAAKRQSEEKAADEEFRIIQEAQRRKAELYKQFAQDAWENGDFDSYLANQQLAADTEYQIWKDTKQKEIDEDKKAAADRKAIASASVASLGNILGTVGDILEKEGEQNEEAAKAAKGVRIAEAIIQMLQGAVAAYASAQTIPPPAGPIIGAVNAAAVVAAGTANIAQMRKTQIGGTSSGAVSAAVPSAPQVTNSIPQVRNITSASEEERLNKIAKDQRVYVVYSDIEGAGRQVAVQQNESTF